MYFSRRRNKMSKPSKTEAKSIKKELDKAVGNIFDQITKESTKCEIKESVKVDPKNLLSITFCCVELLNLITSSRVIEFWPEEKEKFNLIPEIGDNIEIRYCPFCGTRIRGIEVNFINS